MSRVRVYCRPLVLGTVLLAIGASRVHASQSLEFSWNDSFDLNIVSHNIYWGTQSGPPYSHTNNFFDLVPPIIPGFESGTTNYFAVSAVDVFGNESALSSEVEFTVPFDSSLGLQAQAAPGIFDAVELSWSPSSESDVYGYAIEYGTQSGVYTNSQQIYGTMSGIIYGLTGGMTYYFVIAPIDFLNGVEPFSTNEVLFLNVGPAPVVLTAQMATNLPGVELSWNDTTNQGAYAYNVYCGTDSTNCTQYLDYVTTNDIVLSNLVADETYYFEVTAVDADGDESPLSNVASAVAAASPPPSPMTLQTQIDMDDNSEPVMMEIFNPLPVYGYWEIDASTDLQNWTYVTSGTGYGNGWDVYYQAQIDPTVPQIFYRVVQ